jgi:hypothetical protein
VLLSRVTDRERHFAGVAVVALERGAYEPPLPFR